MSAVFLFAILVGLVIGLLGGGGSVLAVPILHYALEIPSKEAIAMSLLIVGITSLVSTITHARRRNVQWKLGLAFSGSAMLGSYLGGSVSQYIPGSVLLALFASLMLATSILMIRKKDEPNAAANANPDAGEPQYIAKQPITFKLLAIALAVGAFTGLVGAGGGFLVVPALVLLAKMPVKRAIGTSLLVVTLNSFSGFAGHIQHIHIDYQVPITFAVISIAASFLGAHLSHKLDSSKLRRGFGVFVLLMGIAILAQNIFG